MMAAEWIIYSTLIAAISFFAVLLLQMAANAFGIRELSMWAKSEYMHVIVSFLIILFAVAMLTGGSAIIGQLTQQIALHSGNVRLSDSASSGLSDPTEIGKAYLLSVIGCEKDLYRTVYWFNVIFESAGKLTIDIRGEEPVASGFAMSGVSTLYHYINNNVVYLILFHYIQYGMLQFSAYAMLQVFLPIGLALRAFAPTRGVGGLVTAFALGFAFVFPMSYVVIVAMMPQIGGMCAEVGNIQQSRQFQYLTSDYPCFSNEGEQTELVMKLKKEEGWLGGIFAWLKSIVPLLFLQALFYPLAALIITISFIRQTGSLFGADLAEIGRGLVKII